MPTIKLRSDQVNIKIKTPKIKVLWYSDFLRQTGFGNVAEEILTRLNATGKYQFVVLGINHLGQPYNYEGSDYYHMKDIPVWPASYMGGDLLGRTNLANMLGSQTFDIFFALQDTFNMTPMKESIMEARKIKKFKYVFYFPVDSELHKDWVENGVKIADYPITYTEYGKKQVYEYGTLKNLQVINHGVDTTKFYEVETNELRQKYRKKIFGI